MNQVLQNAAVTTDIATAVHSGVMDAGVVQVARDLLAGYYDGYFFFQMDASHYALCLSDSLSAVSAGGGYISYTVGECDWYCIEVSQTSHTVAVQESGSASGGYAGYNSGGQYSGSYSGSFSLQTVDPPVYQVYFYRDFDGVTISNSQSYAVYSSLDGLPHLIDGSDYYAYAQTALFCVVCLFVLVSHVFKHIS